MKNILDDLESGRLKVDKLTSELDGCCFWMKISGFLLIFIGLVGIGATSYIYANEYLQDLRHEILLLGLFIGFSVILFWAISHNRSVKSIQAYTELKTETDSFFGSMIINLSRTWRLVGISFLIVGFSFAQMIGYELYHGICQHYEMQANMNNAEGDDFYPSDDYKLGEFDDLEFESEDSEVPLEEDPAPPGD